MTHYSKIERSKFQRNFLLENGFELLVIKVNEQNLLASKTIQHGVQFLSEIKEKEEENISIEVEETSLENK